MKQIAKAIKEDLKQLKTGEYKTTEHIDPFLFLKTAGILFLAVFGLALYFMLGAGGIIAIAVAGSFIWHLGDEAKKEELKRQAQDNWVKHWGNK